MKQVNELVATPNIIVELPASKILIVTNYDENDLLMLQSFEKGH